jgi:hypothetical protein
MSRNVWLLMSLSAAILAATASAQTNSSLPLFEGLGSHTRTVTTSSTDAQKHFNQGLAFLYAFNHDEAIRSFRHAAELDPKCTMAWWGVSLANGPHINNPVVTTERAKAAWDALVTARQLAPAATNVERELIAALAHRYADPQPEDRQPLNEAYASAMRDLWKLHQSDADIGALFAEALMDLRPLGSLEPNRRTPARNRGDRCHA